MPLPTGIGLEASAVVEAVGEGVTGLKAGDRVAYGTGPIGAYAERRNFPAEKLIKIPDAHRRQDRRRHDAAGHDGANT